MPPRKRVDPTQETPGPDDNAPLPCTECLPGGWPDGASAVGCTHGTWTRDTD